MLSIFNYLQYSLQKPWRSFVKKPNSFWRFAKNNLGLLYYAYSISMYFLLIPLRFANAMYYNVWIYGLWGIRDNYQDVFFPKAGVYGRKKGFIYLIYWLFGLPIRCIKYGSKSFFQLVEGGLYVIHDTILPTLTMYHGTQREAAISISKPGKWRVGAGNYAGSGIYFAMHKKTAKHYAGKDDDAVIIYARVTLGKNLNLASAPEEVVQYIGKAGEQLTKWGVENGYVSYEWWRSDMQWWEYCILAKHNAEFIRSSRIRVLFVKNLKTGAIERIWGGKAHWFFNF